jgi:hypothetical protein
MEIIIDEIIALEWEMFTNTVNVGERASCQDDAHTFEINRRSQFETWDGQTLESYLRDLRDAKANGANLVAFKYGYMMGYSYPAEFASVKDDLPEVTDEKRGLVRYITDIHLAWRAELRPNFPRILGKGRPEKIADETPGFVSVESYTLGELQSMSMRTLTLYKSYIDNLKSDGKNLAYMILDNTAKLYGYRSLEAAENA